MALNGLFSMLSCWQLKLNQFRDLCRAGEAENARALLERHPRIVLEAYTGLFDNLHPWNDAARCGNADLLARMEALLRSRDSPLAKRVSAEKRERRLMEQLKGYSASQLDTPLSNAAAAGHAGTVAQLIRMVRRGGKARSIFCGRRFTAAAKSTDPAYTIPARGHHAFM